MGQEKSEIDKKIKSKKKKDRVAMWWGRELGRGCDGGKEVACPVGIHNDKLQKNYKKIKK